MLKDYQINRFRGFRGIVTDVTDELIAMGYVPDAENMTIDIEGIARNLANPTKQVYLTDAPAWQANHVYQNYEVVQPAVPNGYLYYASVNGTSSGTEPAWGTNETSEIVDGTQTWKYLCRTSDEIKKIYLWDELDTPVLMVQTFKASNATYMSVIDTTNWVGKTFPNYVYPVSFASASVAGSFRLYIMNRSTAGGGGLWWYSYPLFTDISNPTDGKPPYTKHILVWNNRLWAYGNLVEADKTTEARFRIRCSSIVSKPEAKYDENGNPLPAPPNTGFDFWDETYGYDSDGTPIPQGNHFDLVTAGHDDIQAVHSYGQMLGVVSKDSVMFISGTSDTTFQTSIVYQGHDGAIISDMVEADALYYLSRNGCMAFTTPNPVDISKAINSTIKTTLATIDADAYVEAVPKNLVYFKQRLYFLLNDKIWAYHLERKTWEKYSYSNIRCLHSADHLYMGDTTGKVWKLDVAGSGFTTWYLYTPHLNWGDTFIKKAFESMAVYYKIPSASSTLLSAFYLDYSTTANNLTNKQMYLASHVGEMKDYSQRTISGAVGTIQYKFSGTGEVKLFGYDVVYKLFWRKRG